MRSRTAGGYDEIHLGATDEIAETLDIARVGKRLMKSGDAFQIMEELRSRNASRA